MTAQICFWKKQHVPAEVKILCTFKHPGNINVQLACEVTRDFWRTQSRWGWWFEAIWSLRIGEVSGRAGGWLHAKKPMQKPICFPKSSPGSALKSWIMSMTFLEFQWIADVSLAPRPFFTWLLRSRGRVCLAVPTSNVPGKKHSTTWSVWRSHSAAQNEAFLGVFHGSFVIYTRSSMGCLESVPSKPACFCLPLDMGVWSPSWCFTQWKLKMRDPPQQLSLKPNVIFLVEVQVSTGILGVEHGINQVTKEFRDLTGPK